MRFSRSFQLPDYLEEALAPFSWSGILSSKFRDDVVSCIICERDSRQQVVKDFIASIRLLRFLNEQWVDELTSALTRFAEEGFKVSR